MDTILSPLQKEPQSIARWRSYTFYVEVVTVLPCCFCGVCRHSLVGHAEGIKCTR
jgi:hypothetical protein